jgi:opacity protein-like surface antigen
MKLDILKPLGMGLLCAGLLAMPAQAASGADLAARQCVAVVLDLGSVSFGETGFGSGLKYGGGAFFRTGKHAGIEIAVARFDVPVAAGTAATGEWPAGLGAGRMTTTTLLINQHWYILSHGRILPYALMGIGFSFIGYAPDAPPMDGIERDFVDRMALQLGAGVDYRLTSRLAACAKVRGNLAKTWVEILPRTAPIRDTDPLAQNMLELYGLELSFGLRFAF